MHGIDRQMAAEQRHHTVSENVTQCEARDEEHRDHERVEPMQGARAQAMPSQRCVRQSATLSGQRT